MGRHLAAAALGLLFSLLATPVRAYYFYTYPDWASCTQSRDGNVVSSVCNACTNLSPAAGSIMVGGPLGSRVQRWASVNCLGTSSEVQVSSPCTPFFGMYARLLAAEAPCPSPAAGPFPSPTPFPTPSHAPGGSGSAPGDSSSNGFYTFLLIPAVIALIGVRCFCCPLDRRVTGLPVRSRRHRHDLRFTVSADGWGDCLASINNNASNSSGNSSAYASSQQPQFTFKDLRCAACGQQTRQSYTCSECSYVECAGCFQAVGGGAAVAAAPAPPSAKPATLLRASAPPSAAEGASAPLLDSPRDPGDPEN